MQILQNTEKILSLVVLAWKEAMPLS